MPGSGDCTIMPNIAMGNSCLTATDIQAGRSPDGMAARTRGAGCKDDSGPLWVSIALQDDEEVGGSNGGGDVPRTVWARLFQKKSDNKRRRRRARRSSRYAQTADYYPTQKKSDLVECMALQLCTATAP